MAVETFDNDLRNYLNDWDKEIKEQEPEKDIWELADEKFELERDQK